MGAKKSIGKWTLVALAAYELTLAGISLTPVAGKGTSFGEPAMWRNLVLIAAFYLIPLIFYYLHIEVMRYILAAVVIFWTIPIPFFTFSFITDFFLLPLVVEQAHSRKGHHHIVLVAGSDHLVIPHGTAGLGYI